MFAVLKYPFLFSIEEHFFSCFPSWNKSKVLLCINLSLNISRCVLRSVLCSVIFAKDFSASGDFTDL